MLSDPSADPRGMAEAREAMVAKIRACGLLDPAVLAAMGRVRRHAFFPGGAPEPEIAYGDFPCAIGHDATISQPFIVAYMTHRLAIRPGDRVLEIGTGSGYQAAVLAEMGMDVVSVERIGALAKEARKRLERLGYPVLVVHGDGRLGYPPKAPYGAVLVTAAAPRLEEAWTSQLEEGGRLVVPLVVGPGLERILVRERTASGNSDTWSEYCRFVPLLPGLDERGFGEENADR